MPETYTIPAYPAAREAARRILPHFQRHSDGDAPDAEAMEAIIGAAFWASLRREEGLAPTISIAYMPRERSERPLVFAQAQPLSAYSLTKLAAAVERPGIHLGVSRNGGEYCVWGSTTHIPVYTFVVEVVAPGLLVVKHRRTEGAVKFVNVAVLEGEEVKVLDEGAGSLPGCPAVVTSLLGFESPAGTGSVDVLVELAVSMRAHGRGGSLLVVPSGSDEWLESVVQPVTYAVSPAYTELADLMQEDPQVRSRRQWQDALRRSVAGIAGLTAVDGATVINDKYELLAFGAKIGRRWDAARIEQVIVTEPVEGAAASVVHPTQLGGTRHLSAAQFAHDQRDSVALVASQDGRFTIFSWSPCEDCVHAHRVEALLL